MSKKTKNKSRLSARSGLKSSKAIVAGAAKKLKRVPLLRGAHWMVDKMFRLRGYSFELRRNGELKLGLWRKSWRRPGARKGPVKRLILLPGFGDTPLSWLIVLTFITPVIRLRYDEIIMLDFPGYAGFLSREKAFHSLDRLLEAVFDVFDSLRPHTVLGHSLGGYIAARYAADSQSETRQAALKQGYIGPEKVILVNPSGVFESEESRHEFERRFKMAMTEGFGHIRPHLFAKEPKWFRLFLDEFQDFIFREDIHQFIESINEQHLIGEYLGRIRAPVWLIWGEKDSLISSACVPIWLQGLVGTRTPSKGVVLKKLGHSPQVENPLVTATVLGQILSDRSPRPVQARWWTIVS